MSSPAFVHAETKRKARTRPRITHEVVQTALAEYLAKGGVIHKVPPMVGLDPEALTATCPASIWSGSHGTGRAYIPSPRANWSAE